jgi:hypothetical protein
MATTTEALSNWAEEYVLYHLVGTTALTDYTSYNLEVSLHSGNPGENGTDSELDNTNEPGYARQTVSRMDITIAQDGSGFAATNNNTIEFSASGGNWTNAPTHLVVWDTGALQPIFIGAIDDGASGALSALTDGKKLQITAGNLKMKLS